MLDERRSKGATPPASSPGVRRRMQATRQRDTPAEIALRSALHRRGHRFRPHRFIKGVPRVCPDIVFVSAKVAVFVDGCFWHRCPEHGSEPKSNRDWWRKKLVANVERDRRNDVELQAAGWSVVRVWEHDETDSAADQVEQVIRAKRTTP